MTQDRGLPPLRKTLELAVAPAAAFRLWTEDFGRWWPLAQHSVGRAEALDCTLEGRVGGRIFETTRTGTCHLWGTISVFEPPCRLRHSWHPGRSPAEATTIELTFGPGADDGCRLVLVHDGWPDGSAGRRAGYERGWEALLRDDYGAWVAAVTAGGRASA